MRLAGLLFAVVLQLTSQAPVDLERIGPKVGEVAPEFTLPDQHGQPRTLSSLAGPKGTMLVFYRSADW